LAQHHQTLQESNHQLFVQAQRIGENLGVIGEGVDKAAVAVSGAAEVAGGGASKWSRFWTILGAGAGGAAAAVVGVGTLPAGLLTAGGALVVGYTAGVTGEYITDAKTKVQGWANAISTTVSNSLSTVASIGDRIINLGSGIVGLLSRMAGFGT
jgi:hypothetical protein